MAVDVCFSPRLSFSHDLNDTDAAPAAPRQDAHLLDSSSSSGADFDFCIAAAFIELSSAEDLFSDGKILPGEIKTSRSRSLPPPPPPPPPPPQHSEKKKRLKEFLSASSDTEDDYSDEPPPPKPFWQFKRSSSLNCAAGAGAGNTSLIRSLHFLSRSNSTGSVPNRNLKRQPSSVSSRRSTSSSSSSSGSSSFGMPYVYGPYKKKNYGGGIKVSPVLNFQPHISIGTGNLFGLGSLFCNGKVRRKKKK